MSSGCVFKNLFTCEKNCNSVEARKALLEDFTKKRYNADVVYVDNDGKPTKEQYKISFILSKQQEDPTLTKIYGFSILQTEADTSLVLSWVGTYLEKKKGYKIRLFGGNIDKDFYVYCDGNDKINFLIKKTVSEDSNVRQANTSWVMNGVGTMVGSDACFQCLGPANDFGGDTYLHERCLQTCQG